MTLLSLILAYFLSPWQTTILSPSRIVGPVTIPAGGGGGGGTITLVNATCAYPATGSTTVTTTPINTVGATLEIVLVGDYSSSTITSSPSNTYNALTSYGSSPIATLNYLYSPATGASQTITVTGTSGAYPSACLVAFSGTTGSTVDQQNGATACCSASVATGSVTPTANNELVIAGGIVVGQSSGITVGSPFSSTLTQAFNAGYLTAAIAWVIQTTATAENPTFSYSAAAASASIATFK